MCRVRLLFIALLLPVLGEAQDDEATLIIEQRIEAIAELLDEDVELDYTTLFDKFSHYLDRPLNLNTATELELQDLLLLTEFQIIALQRHIDQYGKLQSIYELQAVEGYDLQTIRNILPFVTVQPPGELESITWAQLKNEGTHDVVMRYHTVLEQAAGFTNQDDTISTNDFEGNAARIFLRYRYRYKDHISLGFTAEKDPGESLFAGSNPGGFDFYSAHLHYRDDGLVRNVTLGDYQIQFGQGVSAWSGMGFGKSSYVMNVKRSGRGIRPYTSVDENRFMRGAAFTLGTGNWTLTGFYSSKNIDANVVEADTLAGPEGVTVSSFQLTGLHRTLGEIADADAIRERHTGGHLRYHTRAFSVGVTGLYSDYNADVVRNLTTYNQFDFNANTNTVVGADYHYLRGNVNLFGEVSRSASGGVALLQGALLALHPDLNASVVYRRYDRDYHNLLALPFGELSRPANESGVYTGLEWKLNRHWRLSAYADQFRFPWLRFRVDAPSQGVDHLVQLNYKPSRKNEFYARFRRRVRERNASGTDAVIDTPVDELRQQVRLNASFYVAPSFRVKSRVEWVRSQIGDDSPENGFLFYQDLIFKKIEWPVTFAMRYALFDTESWDSRVYAYENDVLFSWSIPPYFGRGARFYLMAKWRVYKKVDLWLRYSEWAYTDRNEIGSGLNAIQGSEKREVKVQVRWRF